MRLAYLVNQYPKVSHTFIRREIFALERQGFHVTRIALRGWNDVLVDPEDTVERQRTRFVLRDGAVGLIVSAILAGLRQPWGLLAAFCLACRMGWRAERPLWVHFVYLLEACQVARWLKTEDVSHLHAHFGTNSADVALLSHTLTDIPWSLTVHGPEEFDKAHSVKLAEKVHRCKFVVAISSYGRSQLYRLVQHTLWSKIHLVYCGFDPPRQLGPPLDAGSANRLVCVGRLSEQKGHLLLVEAAHLLNQKRISFELVLVGDGEFRAVLQRLIEKYQLNDKIRITGWLSNSEVLQELVAARALVQPSFAEGLPIVIMEAMSVGRPVIATYVGGIPELVIPGDNGWLVPAGDVTGLAEAMERCLCMDASIARTMGEAARKRVVERHSIDTNIVELAKLFRH